MHNGPAADFLVGIATKAQLMRAGHQAGLDQAIPGLRPDGLLFAGMGGSGAAALLVRDAASGVLDTPFCIAQGQALPRHVKAGWHALAVSYSGETEETVASAREAARRGCAVTAFSTGGTLAQVAARHVRQPSGYMPRVALGHAWFSLLGFLEGSGLLGTPVPVKQAVAAVREVDAACGPDVPEARNEAKQLARLLHERIPQLYATPPMAGAGTFFASLLNENAKKIAACEAIPECNHNSVAGFSGDGNRRHFTVLVLGAAGQGPEMERRIEFMRQAYTHWGVPWKHLEFAPTSTFAEHVVQQARALQLLDYTSYYTALLRGVDPAEIEAVKGLKAFLRHPGEATAQVARPRPPRTPQRRSHPAQPPSVLQVMEAFAGRPPMTVADLRAVSGLPRRTVSAALRILRTRGALHERPSLRDTRQTYYWLDSSAGPGLVRTLPEDA